MSSQFELSDTDFQVLVEFHDTTERGPIDVSRVGISEIAERSSLALSNAMLTINNVAHRVISSLTSIPLVEQPDHIELQFGLKLTADAQALIASASTECQINVKLSWDNKEAKQRVEG